MMNTEKMMNTENTTSHNSLLSAGVACLAIGASGSLILDLPSWVAFLFCIAGGAFLSVRGNLLRHQDHSRRPSKLQARIILTLTAAAIALGVFVLASA